MITRRLHRLASALLAGLCSLAVAAPPEALSADGRWRVGGQDGAVLVFDAGRIARTLPARSLGGREDAAAVVAVRYVGARRSFIIAFDTLPELWELSVDPDAPPLYEGLVHDYRMGEAIASPGFLGVRRTRLDAPARSLDADARGPAYVAVTTADGTRLIVNLDVRGVIERKAQGER